MKCLGCEKEVESSRVCIERYSALRPYKPSVKELSLCHECRAAAVVMAARGISTNAIAGIYPHQQPTAEQKDRAAEIQAFIDTQQGSAAFPLLPNALLCFNGVAKATVAVRIDGPDYHEHGSALEAWVKIQAAKQFIGGVKIWTDETIESRDISFIKIEWPSTSFLLNYYDAMVLLSATLTN